jgi:hypothetical protein
MQRGGLYDSGERYVIHAALWRLVEARCNNVTLMAHVGRRLAAHRTSDDKQAVTTGTGTSDEVKLQHWPRVGLAQYGTVLVQWYVMDSHERRLPGREHDRC